MGAISLIMTPQMIVSYVPSQDFRSLRPMTARYALKEDTTPTLLPPRCCMQTYLRARSALEVDTTAKTKEYPRILMLHWTVQRVLQEQRCLTMGCRRQHTMMKVIVSSVTRVIFRMPEHIPVRCAPLVDTMIIIIRLQLIMLGLRLVASVLTVVTTTRVRRCRQISTVWRTVRCVIQEST